MTYYYPIIIPIGGDGYAISAENNPLLFWAAIGILMGLLAIAVGFFIWLTVYIIRNHY